MTPEYQRTSCPRRSMRRSRERRHRSSPAPHRRRKPQEQALRARSAAASPQEQALRRRVGYRASFASFGVRALRLAANIQASA